MSYKVTFTIPWRELGRADVEFKVERDGTTSGSLKISKGSVVWRPRNRTHGHKIPWDRFAELMTEHGDRE